MERNWRPCPIFTGPLRDTPKWVTEGPLINGKRSLSDTLQVERDYKRWELARCGSVVKVWPFINRRLGERIIV